MHENHSQHRGAKTHTGPEELNNVHGAIQREARALRDPVESAEANKQRDNPHHNRRPLAISHSASFGQTVQDASRCRMLRHWGPTYQAPCRIRLWSTDEDATRGWQVFIAE